MKKIMLVGESGAGKTTLIQSLLDRKIEYSKTQALNYYDYILDTPGEYLENRRFYNSLLVSSANYEVIGLVQDSTSEKNLYPPQFASMFANKEIIGIVTKADSDSSDVERAKESLKYAGANEVIVTSAFEKEGLDRIKELLNRE